jgi:mono/diheme cytochrome c family protein
MSDEKREQRRSLTPVALGFAATVLAGLATVPARAYSAAAARSTPVRRDLFFFVTLSAVLAACASPCASQPKSVSAGSLRSPPGATAEEVAQGQRLFRKSACTGCHGPEAKGTALAPDLTAGIWLWSDGTLPALRKTISEGVAKPRKFVVAMPPKGGMPFTEAELTDIATYVWAISHHDSKR